MRPAPLAPAAAQAGGMERDALAAVNAARSSVTVSTSFVSVRHVAALFAPAAGAICQRVI